MLWKPKKNSIFIYMFSRIIVSENFHKIIKNLNDIKEKYI